ncbi:MULTISPECIES: thiol:disulfide interchange protein DsbA/DsbL [unclassified Duganella]|uniref:thiol:disulfide interchange protein DsbA/DsbL n=1 Tax=unclassified Duganella TaxID=2636909 RepID=UPI00088DFA87|nr:MULTISPECIES: thiol:disulfide interchange protein DsbA/DsbL [unclassified Duganella]SDG72516.1 thiol:disulfide interchange protein DsbA [Duganella sp. OV458]SDJ98623.1 Thiol:disulfide interchange protein DsbA [Duganella sp. OV510]
MRFLKFILTAITLSAVAFTASASPTDPKEGTEFKTLAKPQPVDTGKKVEIIEFFDYACPHCAAFDATLNAWVKKQGDNIVFKRVHIGRQGTELPQARMFYTLQSMGALTPELHTKAFNEIHVNHNRLNRDEQVFDFVAKQGVDKQKFTDTYRGFGVAAQVRKSLSMMDAYNVEFWPLLIVDGKYQTAPSMANANATSEAQLNESVTQVLDALVVKAKAEKK